MKTEWLERALIVCPNFCLCLTEKDFQAALDDLKIKKKERPTFVIEGAIATAHHFSCA